MIKQAKQLIWGIVAALPLAMAVTPVQAGGDDDCGRGYYHGHHGYRQALVWPGDCCRGGLVRVYEDRAYYGHGHHRGYDRGYVAVAPAPVYVRQRYYAAPVVYGARYHSHYHNAGPGVHYRGGSVHGHHGHHMGIWRSRY